MASFTRIIYKKNENDLINSFKKFLLKDIKDKTKKNKRYTFVLTGGNSPIKLYKKLAKIKNIPWKKIDFFIGDERYVKETSPYSNINLCRRFLLNKLKISNRQIFYITTKLNSVQKDSIKYEDKIKTYFKKKNISFDLILLGLGNDGHIASLFKQNIKNNTNKNIDFVIKNDFPRITFTINCINKCKKIFLWAPGKNKLIIVKKICKDKKHYYPASFIENKNSFLFYCN